jgi:large subunit ribosomal protein L9
MATTEVLLTENIPGLGAEADIVKVRAGYARNFLFPQHKALEVNPSTLKRLNALKAKRAEREAREVNEAEELARKINKLRLVLTLETGESGKAFGSITTSDLAQKVKGELGGIEIDRHKIHLESPVKQSGDFEAEVKLHPAVTATLHFSVKAANADDEGEAAEAQAADEPKGFKAKAKARHKTE